MRPFQPFRPVGFSHGLIQFVTKSWTGQPDEYEVTFDVASRNVTCSCCDSVMRRKNYLPIGDPGACKHSRLAADLLWPVIARAIGAQEAVS